jgi:hypothetical protein
MKGTIFLKPLEYNLEVIGEKWRQGDKIRGSLKVRNHGADAVDFPELNVVLCEGTYKKIKAKDAKGWKSLIETKLEDKFTLKPAEEKSYSFEYTLPEDCLVTDKNASLYLAFFDRDVLPAGHIELVIEPKLVISQILDLIQSFLRFKVVQVKFTKGMIEVKLTPPASSRELSTIDTLILSLAEKEKALLMNYEFNMRVLDMTGGVMQSQKKTREFDQSFTSRQYLQYDSLNQDFILESINSVLNEVRPKFL